MGRGIANFEWLEVGALLLERADGAPSEEAPSGWIENWPLPVLAVMGLDDTTRDATMLYTDARGVRRIYRMTVTDHAWTVWRDAPGFFQRYIGTFGEDGATIDGRWEASPDGSEWTVDFDLAYRRTSEEVGRWGD